MRLDITAALGSLLLAAAAVLLFFLPVNRHHSSGASNVFGETVAVPVTTVRCGTVIGDEPGYMTGNDCAVALQRRRLQGVGAGLLSVASLILGIAVTTRERRRRAVRPDSM